MSYVVVTGANGKLGKRLLREMTDHRIRAVVRSPSAKADLQKFIDEHELKHVEISECNYLDAQAMSAAIRDGFYLVHLVGIIKETKTTTFFSAHEQTADVLKQALQGSQVKRVLYLSLMGAAQDAKNPCLWTRAVAEQRLVESGVSTLNLRIPMVLGEGDYASFALKKRSQGLAFTFRSSSLEQPIYAGDVIRAICLDINKTAAGQVEDSATLELAGPESLTRTALQQRANHVLGSQSTLVSLPLWLGTGTADLLGTVLSNPPVSRAMLEVLDHDDCIDAQSCADKLGIELTSLDSMLRLCLIGNADK